MTIYILGAGFSSDLGLPLTPDLFDRVVSVAKSHELYPIHDSLYLIYPFFKREFRNYPNIEDVLSFYQMRVEWDEIGLDRGKRQFHERSEKLLRQLLVRYFLKASFDVLKKEEIAYYLEFARKVKPGDVIITFNYDYIIDICLSAWPSLKALITYTERSPDKISIFKLHGSAGWLSHPLKVNDIMITKTTPIWPRIASDPPIYDLDPSGIDILVNQKYDIGDLMQQIQSTENLESFVIAPTAFKSPRVAGNVLFKKLWGLALDSLKEANNIVVIGYSLPITDLGSRILLREGVNQNPNNQDSQFVTVYDPNIQIKNIYERHITEKVAFKSTRFIYSELVK